ncbi:hypothetical protein LWI29_032620 [Acer saccharum]|uniref:RNase H type-1 domain-containing protein n=1 Tax=Acer saccharum TaxID=4024 RepID=A0AA39SHI4_ACESA|nr:hypothetical protein LWI29_032620 [Acer saccharum]
MLIRFAEFGLVGRRGWLRNVGGGMRWMIVGDRRIMVCEANYDMDCAKAMVVYKGFIVGKYMGLVNYVVETDSETMIKQILKGGNSEASYGGILDAIQILALDARNVAFQFVSTKANMVALALANEALSITDMAVWKEDVPMCIRAMVEDKQRI